MENLEKPRKDFESRGTVALGMSVDSVPSNKAWPEDLGVENVQLLVAFYPHGEFAQAYDIFSVTQQIARWPEFLNAWANRVHSVYSNQSMQ